MTQIADASPAAPSAPERAARTNAEYRWHPDKAYAFFDALARHGKVAMAAREVGMSRQSAYRLRERVPQVAKSWDLAREMGRKRRHARGPVQVLAGSGQGDASGGAR